MGDPEFRKVLDEMWAVHVQKSADYGKTGDRFANYSAGERSGYDAWESVWLRIEEKVTRLENFVATGKLHNEQIEESLLDLANHVVIMLVLYRRKEAERCNGNLQLYLPPGC